MSACAFGWVAATVLPAPAKTVEFTLRALPDQMKYDQTELVVEPGDEVQLTFRNDNRMPHNVVVCLPRAPGAPGASPEDDHRFEVAKAAWGSGVGSEELETFKPVVTAVTVAPDRKSARLIIDGLKRGHVHELKLPGLRDAQGGTLLHPIAWYTVNAIPVEIFTLPQGLTSTLISYSHEYLITSGSAALRDRVDRPAFVRRARSLNRRGTPHGI